MEARIKFRLDLEAYKYDDIESRDTIVLKDPLAGKYFYLSVSEHRLLKALDGNRTLDEAIAFVAASGYYYSPEDAASIVGKAAQLGLLMGTKFGTAEFQSQLKRQMEAANKAKRFSSVYFMFIPLLNPDRFLERTLWIARLFGNKWMMLLWALALPGAIYIVLSEIPRMESEYLFFFNWQNLLCLWVTLGITKLIHEFAHAYVAKSFGLHVPQMGVAFLIFFPCLFCNTTDAWQLADRKQRIAISAAGIVVEGVLATMCTYLWYFSGPGIVNSLAFYLMAISFLSTVLFNGNPLMRFDGYFILMDLLRLPNLATRSVGYLKYLFLNKVLGISLVSNPATTLREVAIFASYGVSAFLYRVFLYVSIAMGVYYRFDKMLGVLLALLAVALFIMLPLIRGAKTLFNRRAEIRPNPVGVLVFAGIVASTAAVFIVPFTSTSIFPCYLSAAVNQKLTIPLQTSVDRVFIREGTPVSKGDLLFTLDTSRLQLELIQKKANEGMLRTELKFLLQDESERGKVATKKTEIRRLGDQMKRVAKDLQMAQGGIVAPFDGIVTRLDYKVQAGLQTDDGAVVGEVESPNDCVVHALVPSKDLHKIHLGVRAIVWFPIGVGVVLEGAVHEIKPYSERDLKDCPFSSRYGGEIATEARGEERSDVPLDARYLCSVNLDNSRLRIPLGITGKLVVHSPPSSLLDRLIDKVRNAFNKESLF